MLDASILVDVVYGMDKPNSPLFEQMVTDLLTEIDAFLDETGMSEKYFGKIAANNTYAVPRLRTGASIQLETVARLKSFMNERKNAERA